MPCEFTQGSTWAVVTKEIWTAIKNRNRLRDTENKLAIPRGRGAGRGDEISEGG